MSLKEAREVIRIEAEAIRNLASRINDKFEKAVELISKCKGRVIVAGMGKTGIIGRKIAATLSSTGTPSIWMHCAEAVHGDLGQVTRNDILIIISYSGETDETKKLLPLIRKIGSKIIAITGNPKSSLAKFSDIDLDVSVKKEGCPLDLAPMASTTATLVMGDALAACLIAKKGFRR
ncbi:MAG: SIS domain-containing protein, partial [Candidatus Omnitrophica bacterium]|nr:SIS domain-containing protein [Candidatus Omnitrophota bacterium]